MQKYNDVQSFRAQFKNTEVVSVNDGNEKSKKIISSILGIALAVGISGSIPFLSAKISQDNVQPIEQDADTPASAPDITQHQEAFAWTAKLKLQELMLHHRLDITTTQTDGLEIKGSISLQEKERWTQFLDWYEARESFPELKHQVSTTAVSGNIPNLKSVWFGSNPTAYFQDGSFGNVGTYIQDGWKVVGIEPWGVFVERDAVVITLGYE